MESPAQIFISFFPIIFIQAIFAIFTYKVAIIKNENGVIAIILTLIPFIGFYYFLYVQCKCILEALRIATTNKV